MNPGNPASREAVVTVRGGPSGVAQIVESRSHRLVADEPVVQGGTDTGPTPYELLVAALGT
jgi:putative redox protein